MMLPDFEGVEVVQASVRITKAGDGLSDSLKLKPVARHVGDEGFYVLRTVCTQVNHKPLTPTVEALERVHTETVTEIAMVDEADVKALLDAQAERLRQARERDEGIQRLPYEGTDELMLEHEKGEHADEMMDGCPLCAEEREAEEDGD